MEHTNVDHTHTHIPGKKYTLILYEKSVSLICLILNSKRIRNTYFREMRKVIMGRLAGRHKKLLNVPGP